MVQIIRLCFLKIFGAWVFFFLFQLKVLNVSDKFGEKRYRQKRFSLDFPCFVFFFFPANKLHSWHNTWTVVLGTLQSLSRNTNVVKCLKPHKIQTTPAVADPGWGARPSCPQDFLNHAVFRQNPLFWANFRLRAPLWAKTPLPPDPTMKNTLFKGNG